MRNGKQINLPLGPITTDLKREIKNEDVNIPSCYEPNVDELLELIDSRIDILCRELSAMYKTGCGEESVKTYKAIALDTLLSLKREYRELFD